MSKGESNPLSQWYSNDEYQKLIQPLEGIMPSSIVDADVVRSSEWGIVDVKEIGGRKTLFLQNGLSKIELRMWESIALLWSGRTPANLMPGCSVDAFRDTMRFLIYDMPLMVGRTEMDEDPDVVFERLLQKTSIDMYGKDDKRRSYRKLGNPFNQAKLAADFCDPSEVFTSFSIAVKNGSEKIYALRVKYDVAEHRYAHMSLDLERQDKASFICEETLSEWILGTMPNASTSLGKVEDLANFLTTTVRTN